MIYIRLFYEFFITGILIFGGGLAQIPFLQQMGERTGWFTQQQLATIIAIGETTPGPMGINMATFTGYIVAGTAGGIAATAGLVMPSVIIALTVARLLVKFRSSAVVNGAFHCLRPASAALIAFAGLTVLLISIRPAELYAESFINIRAAVFAVILFPIVLKFKLHPMIFLAGSAMVGIIFRL